ncbi:MAG: hypothetical protein JW963_05735 [Anaerolineales bacterium]|nr:hypothetical protein [Anaerolineales bacterium]
MLEFVRSEWSIENGLHYRRDVTFHEDKTRMTLKTIARSMAIINNLVIALLHNQGFTYHAQARRMFDAKPFAALTLRWSPYRVQFWRNSNAIEPQSDEEREECIVDAKGFPSRDAKTFAAFASSR